MPGQGENMKNAKNKNKKPDFSKSNKMLTKLPSKKQTDKDKKELLSYLSAAYGVTYFNKAFVFKLNHIHDGTLQNLQNPIPYGVLLGMFKRYKNYLSEQRIYNKQKGKTFDRQGALLYDLAIVLAKHSDYLEESEREKERCAETAKNSPEVAKLVQLQVANKVKEKTDISQMMEEW